jgi:hypothetical protein
LYRSYRRSILIVMARSRVDGEAVIGDEYVAIRNFDEV